MNTKHLLTTRIDLIKIVSCVFITTSFLLGCDNKKNTEVNTSKIDSIAKLQSEVDSLKTVNDSLAHQLTLDTTTTNYWYDPLYDGSNLLRKGIENPQQFIEQSLRKEPSLIPMEGVLGGTMRFGKIQPLGSQWVIAYYEDGHIEGRAIYKYQLNEQGKLEFKLLDDIKPEE